MKEIILDKNVLDINSLIDYIWNVDLEFPVKDPICLVQVLDKIGDSPRALDSFNYSEDFHKVLITDNKLIYFLFAYENTKNNIIQCLDKKDIEYDMESTNNIDIADSEILTRHELDLGDAKLKDESDIGFVISYSGSNYHINSVQHLKKSNSLGPVVIYCNCGIIGEKINNFIYDFIKNKI